MAKYLVLNGKRMTKAQMCNILNDLEKCYFEPIDYDYKLMVDVFVCWMKSLSICRRYEALAHIYTHVNSAYELSCRFYVDVIVYYGK